MRLKTILNKCCQFKGFVIGDAMFDQDERIVVEISQRKGSMAVCGRCGTADAGHDRLAERWWRSPCRARTAKAI